MLINNGYMVYSNINQLKQIYWSLPNFPNQLQRTSPKVNKHKVLLSIFWFFTSVVGYFLMESYNQGLDLKSSAEMFMFSIFETIFMCSMSMSFFYSWQTYSIEDSKSLSSAEREKHKPEVIEVGFREVLIKTGDLVSENVNYVIGSSFCEKCKTFLDPILSRLEDITGRGGRNKIFELLYRA